MGFSPWAAVPARKPSLCGLSTGYKKTAFITMVYRLQGISVSEAVAYPYLPCSLIWVFAGLFLSRFHHSCLSQGLYSFFHPFLNTYSQRQHQIIWRFSCALQQVHWSQLGLVVSGKRQNLACLTDTAPVDQTPALRPWNIKQIQKHLWEHQLTLFLNKIFFFFFLIKDLLHIPLSAVIPFI